MPDALGTQKQEGQPSEELAEKGVNESIRESINGLYSKLNTNNGKLVLVVQSHYKEYGEDGCFSSKFVHQRDELMLGITNLPWSWKNSETRGLLSEEEIRKIMQEGMKIPVVEHLYSRGELCQLDSLGYKERDWNKKQGEISLNLLQLGSFLYTLDRKKPDSQRQLPLFSQAFFDDLEILVGVEVPEYFSSSKNPSPGCPRIQNDCFIDPGYVFALKLLCAEEKAPEKFKKAYNEFVEETTNEVIEALSGKRPSQDIHPGIIARAKAAELDKADIRISLGKGHYINVAEALDSLR